MALKMNGTIKVYRKDYDGKASYYRKISWHPYKNGATDTSKWESVIQSVQFAGAKTDIPDGATVEVMNAFESGYTTKSGEKRSKLVITEFAVQDEPQEEFSALDIDMPF